MNTAVNTVQALPFQNLFASLGTDFYAEVSPTPLKSPYLVGYSHSLCQALNIPLLQIQNTDFCLNFSGNQFMAGSRPLAAVYSGHQFGVWAGQLGDGRALLLGDLPTCANVNSPTKIEKRHPARYEVQLKGAGITPYSRMGDGRAVLRSSIREFLCSEAMAALGIPTSRALCITASDQYTMREQPEKTAVVTRLAESFIRFGSFEHWYYHEHPENLQRLADFVIEQYFPTLKTANNPYQELLKAVVSSTANLIAHWQSVGFMHGVMNTDNMSILGLTLDYGPFGFMDAYDPQHICNHSDTQGRYAFHMQPRIGQWNCHALAQALLPLIGTIEDTQAALSGYTGSFEQAYQEKLFGKFGLQQKMVGDQQLFDDFFDLMEKGQADFTLAFRSLSSIPGQGSVQNSPIRNLFVNLEALDHWLKRYQERLQQENSNDNIRRAAMNRCNPKFILRNYLAQQAIEKAEQKDFSELNRLFSILENPYDEQEEYESYAALPPDWASKIAVSCSS